jgi:hypothetical protein
MCDFKVHYLFGFFNSLNLNGHFKHIKGIKAHLHVRFQSALFIWIFAVYVFEFASLNTVR